MRKKPSRGKKVVKEESERSRQARNFDESSSYIGASDEAEEEILAKNRRYK